MDEVLKRRLVGALAVMALAFLFSLVLPKPGLDVGKPGGPRVVTLSLEDGSVQEPVDQMPSAQAEKKPAPAESSPPVIGRALDLAIAPESAVIEDGNDDASAEPEMQTTPADEVPFEDTEPPAQLITESAPVVTPKPEPAAPTPKAEPKPEPTKPAPAAVPKVEAKPAVKPAEEKAKPVTPPPLPKPAIVPQKPPPAVVAAIQAKPAKRWFVQAGAYSDIDNARLVEGKIRVLGYAALIAPTEVPDGIRYRVRSGPYPSREQADAARQKLQQAKLPATLVEEGG